MQLSPLLLSPVLLLLLLQVLLSPLQKLPLPMLLLPLISRSSLQVEPVLCTATLPYLMLLT
jgi:hypothetical protein